jgi:hypothetical protein
MKKVFLNILVVSLVYVVFSGHVDAQRVKATASLDSAKILIGDQVKMTLRVDKPAGVKINFPIVSDTIAEKIEVMGHSPIDTLKSGSANIESLIQSYTITCFDSGAYYIPNYWVTYESNGLVDSTPTNSLILQVYTLPIDTTKGPTDIKLPYDAPVTLKEVMPYILGVILIGAIVFFVLYSIKRKKQNRPLFSVPEKPKEPAHVIALRELDRIKNEKLWQKDKVKQYYSDITETIRTYIENRFDIAAMEQTSDETIASFRYRRDLINDKNFSILNRMLMLADMVKFAKYNPLPDDNSATLFDAYFFVNDTKKEEAVKPHEPDKKEEDGNVEEVVLE